MPAAAYFNQFGFYTVRNFLDRDFCTRICQEIEESPTREGGVIPYGTNKEVEREQFKRRLEYEVSASTNQLIENKLLGEIPALEKNYGSKLESLQGLKFGKYRTNDFYKPHVDYFDENNTPEELKGMPQSPIAKDRKTAAIIFLNNESDEPLEGHYCGGNLTFYNLLDNSAFASFGLPLVGEAGLLVTFPPSVLHEVTPITFGNRYSIATWFI